VDQSLTPLTDREDHVQFSTPAFSPDGRFIAVSAWDAGFRDIWLYTAEGEPYRRVTADAHIDRDPTWSADGRWLFFSSDRTGIANIYAVDMASEHLWQVTNVLGGAFQPTVRPDFETIVWQHYAHHGFEIAMMDIAPERWWDRGALPSPLTHAGPLADVIPGRGPLPLRRPFEAPAPAEGSEASAEEGALAEVDPDDPWAEWDLEKQRWWQPDEDDGVDDEYPFDFPMRPYRPLPTLLPPRYVSPAVYSTALGLIGYLFTSGADTLRHYGYSAFVSYRTDANFVSGGGSVTLNKWRPIISAGGSTSAVPYGDIYVYSEDIEGPGIQSIQDSETRYWEKRTTGYLSVSYPLTTKTAAFGRYSASYRTSLDPLPEDPYLPFLPNRGLLSSVGGGWRYATGKAYTYSISPEDARSVSLVGEWFSPLLGSYILQDSDTDGNGLIDPVGFNQLQLTGELREYVSLPWFYNHVLALRASGGASLGDALNFGSFRLGGTFGESGLAVLPSDYRALRGFPFGTVAGNWYYMGSAEYRMPLWRIDWGLRTYPLFLRTLHGAVFVDVGDAVDDLTQGTSPLVGVGGELRLSTVVGWGAGLQLRAGYAFAAAGPGYPIGSIGGAYFRFGTSF